MGESGLVWLGRDGTMKPAKWEGGGLLLMLVIGHFWGRLVILATHLIGDQI